MLYLMNEFNIFEFELNKYNDDRASLTRVWYIYQGLCLSMSMSIYTFNENIMRISEYAKHLFFTRDFKGRFYK